MVWPAAVKHCLGEGNREDGVVFNSKDLFIYDKGHEKENFTHCGKHSQELSLD